MSDSPQVKLNLMSSIRNFVYELLYGLLNNLDLDLRKLGSIRKTSDLVGGSLVPSLPFRNFTIAVKKYAKVDFSSLAQFYWIPYSVPNILSGIVGWKESGRVN